MATNNISIVSETHNDWDGVGAAHSDSEMGWEPLTMTLRWGGSGAWALRCLSAAPCCDWLWKPTWSLGWVLQKAMFKYRWPLKNLKDDFHEHKIKRSRILFGCLIISKSSKKINLIERVFGELGFLARGRAQWRRACLRTLGSILSTPTSFAFSKEQGR